MKKESNEYIRQIYRRDFYVDFNNTVWRCYFELFILLI